MAQPLSAPYPVGGADDERRLRRVAIALATLAPLLFVLQPLAPPWIANISIYGRLLLGPLLVALLLPRLQVWPGLLLLSALLLATGLAPITERLNEFGVLSCSLLGTVVMFRFGAWLGPHPHSQQFWRALVVGVTLANLISMAIFGALLGGHLDPIAFLESINKDDPREQGLNRFSLGNAIEMPFMLTALLYAGVVHSRRSTGYAFPATLNLVAAVVSQSRLVILMALLVLLRELIRSRPSTRFTVLACSAALVAAGWEQVGALGESILLRLSGEDYGSTDDRTFLFGHVISAIEPRHLFFGDGLTSAASLLDRTIREYRTVEAVLLQLPYEIGLVGAGIVVICCFSSNFRHRARLNTITPIGIVAWLQFLAFLPVTTMSPIVGFALGAITLGLRPIAPRVLQVSASQHSVPTRF
jgi:hypothetical protein